MLTNRDPAKSFMRALDDDAGSRSGICNDLGISSSNSRYGGWGKFFLHNLL
jgi:hypothetical protein